MTDDAPEEPRLDPESKRRLRVVLVSGRPPVRSLFADIARPSGGAVVVTALALDAHAILDAAEPLAFASVVVVDASTDRSEAVAVCRTIRETYRTLPISAVFCCPHAAGAADLHGLLGAGVDGLLDLQFSPEEMLRMLQGIARGHGAFHLQTAAGSTSPLLELLAGERATEELSEHDRALLRLVARGLTDHEIGSQLYLSPHTVKHRIDRLRRRMRVRNRIQLAAWAGGQEALQTGVNDVVQREDGAGAARSPRAS